MSINLEDMFKKTDKNDAYEWHGTDETGEACFN